MAKNKVQFQAGYSFFEFIQDYGTEEQCHQALYKWRWPTGFICPDSSAPSSLHITLGHPCPKTHSTRAN